jgi:hypothetical protein
MEKSLISEIKRYHEIMGLKSIILEQGGAKTKAIDGVIDRIFGRSMDDAEKLLAKQEAELVIPSSIEKSLDDLDQALAAGTKTAAEFEDELAELMKAPAMRDFIIGVVERKAPAAFDRFATETIEEFVNQAGLKGGIGKIEQIMGLSKDLKTAQANVKRYMQNIGFEGPMNEKMIDNFVKKRFDPDVYMAGKTKVAGKVGNLMDDFSKMKDAVASQIAKDAKMGRAFKNVKEGLSKFSDDEIKMMEGAVENNFENMQRFVAENTPKWYHEAIGLYSKYPKTINILIGTLVAGSIVGWKTLGFIEGKLEGGIPNSEDFQKFIEGRSQAKADTLPKTTTPPVVPPAPKKGKYD